MMPLVDLREQKKRRTPEELVQHLKTFELDLKFSVGVWYFAPGPIRFHDAYHKPMSIKERLDLCAELAAYGLKGVEAHYPNEVNEDNIELYVQLERDTGVRLITIIPNLFWDREFEFGSLSNPIPEVRRMAINRLKKALELNKYVGTDFAVVWPGIDGYENPFAHDFYGMWDRFEEGLAEAMDAVPGVRIAIEPKPYEPRGNNIWRMTADGLLMCRDVEAKLQHEENKKLLAEGHALVAMNPEVGHVLMGTEDVSYAFARVLREGRLAHSHWNSQPLGNYDQDLDVGVLSPEQTEALLYVLKAYSYRGYFGIDIFPERLSTDQAIKNCMDAIRAANDRINSLDHEKVVWSVQHPDKSKGWLEAYLIRLRALHPENLPPLPELKMS